MFYFDAHCHVLPLDQMIQSQKQGIDYFVCNATRPSDWEAVCDIASRVEGVYPCIGIHPWYVDHLESDWRIKMQLLLKKYPSMMIGEVGMDGKKENMSRQSEIFEICLKMARRYQRPVHIHGYKVWPVIVDILKCYPDVTCLFHRFTGSAAQVKQLINMTNCYFSVMTEKPIQFIPPERLFIESDSPDGLHKPKRVIELAARFNLDWLQLDQNFCDFVGDFMPMKGIHPRLRYNRNEELTGCEK